MEREYIGFFHAARIDALMGLYGRERGEAVAIDRRPLEIEGLRGLHHLAGELVLDGLAAAGQERIDLAHQHRVVAEIDLVGAWRRAALDLVQQARPRTALKERIAARAQ